MKRPYIEFMGNRRWLFLASGIVLAVAIGALFVRGLNLGIEFKGGTTITFTNAGSVSIEKVRQAAVDAGVREPAVQTTSRGYIVRSPETETTSHYFWGQAHDFDVNNPETTEKVFQQIQSAFLEDVEVFTAQQRSITMRPDALQVDIHADAGGIQARRIVDRLYREEQAQLAASVAAE